MTAFVDRARDWRRRAEELRSTANGVSAQVAKASLLDMATALEHHAANLEQTVLKFGRLHETASDTSLLRAYIRRHAPPRPEDED